MPQLAVFECSKAEDSLPVAVSCSRRFQARDKELVQLSQSLLRSARGDSYIAVAKDDHSPHGVRVWLVLFEIDVQAIEDVAIEEILEQLGRLMSLVEVPVSALRPPVVRRAVLDADQRLIDWLVWFRKLPPSRFVKPPVEANPLEFQFSRPSSVLAIIGLVVCAALAASGVAASANPLLQFAFYLFKLVLLSGLVVASLSIPFLAEWCGQAKMLAVCYGLLFLLWRTASSPFLNLQVFGDALLGSVILGTYALGVSYVSMRLQDTLGWAIATNTFFAVVGVALLGRLILFGVLN